MKPINIIPQPTQVTYTSGTFTLTPETRVLSSESTSAIGIYLAKRLSPATDCQCVHSLKDSFSPEQSAIVLQLDTQKTALGNEGYELTVQEHGIRIVAATPQGIFYGCQTLLQLLPPEVGRSGPMSGRAWDIPHLKITDTPRFLWRGMHLDVGRHFMPKDFVKKYIDLIARYKMNIFHWHLTEDQGWRIEIKKYPKLTQVGAWRMANGQQYGGYYTQDDIREIVEYAQSRYVTVVPEIEIPGHSVAALAAYPELSCTGGPFEVWTRWGIAEDVYCAGNDQVFAFLEDVLSEVCGLFPGPYLHIGGDECPKVRWKACPKCQERIRTEELKGEDELQSYFIRRIERFLSAHRKILIGWDEILEGGLAPNAVVMSWRGMQGGVTAARDGHHVIMTPTSHCYFDYPQVHDHGLAPNDYRKYLPLETVYQFEPVPPELSPEHVAYILGAQGNVWTEHLKTQEEVEEMILPRMCALAEVVWSQKAQRNWQGFQTRLESHYSRFEALHLNYHRHTHDES